MLTGAADVSTALLDERMTARCKRKLTLRAATFIQVSRTRAPFDCIGMASIGRQLIHTPHDQLPFLAVGLNAVTEQLVCYQVCDFVGNGLLQEMVAIVLVKLGIEAQPILVQMRDACFLSSQLHADIRAGEGAFEELFGQLVTGLDACV